MPTSTTAPISSATARARYALRARVRAAPVFAIAILVGCRQREYRIPPVDGPLVLEVRYPGAQAVAVTDSISLWGTVGSGKARLRVNGLPVRVEANGGFAAFLPLPAGDAPVLALEARKGRATVRRSVPVTRLRNAVSPRAVLRPAVGWVRLRRLPSDTVDRATAARPVFSRWTPGGALALQLPLGVRLPTEVETDSAVRVRLARGVAVWVSRSETEPTRPPPAALRLLKRLTLVQSRTRSAIGLEAEDALPATVDVVQSHLRWTILGARAEMVEPLAATKGLVRRVSLRDMGGGRVVVDAELAAPPLGWRTVWRDGNAILEIRPAPTAGPDLEGLVVALDPGHPPEGATGPTGLTEHAMSLAVALEAARRLRVLGARPVLTRSTPEPVSLEARIARAEAADAELFVSIHANSPGDGRPPESVDGTRIYWWQSHALDLARALRDSVPAITGQLPMGTVQSNLAVLRPTWFPSVLVEVTALVLPRREAWLRSPEGVSAYAAGIVAGIRGWRASQKPGAGQQQANR